MKDIAMGASALFKAMKVEKESPITETVNPSDDVPVVKETKQPKKKANSKTTKQASKVVSIWTDDIDAWKLYAIGKGESVSSVVNLAMSEYMKRHKLTDTERSVANQLIELRSNK